jgi:FKBP-type peptidyl-prolyl cis-trans isomerase
MRLMKSVLAAALLVSLTACSNETEAPTNPDLGIPFSATDLTVGAGTQAQNGQTVRVYYTGWLYSTSATDNKGSQFEANTSGTGFSFTLGIGQVIQGWDQGIVGMRVGGKRRLIIPPGMAYGSSGSGPIPGNATLIFEIELLGVAG